MGLLIPATTFSYECGALITLLSPEGKPVPQLCTNTMALLPRSRNENRPCVGLSRRQSRALAPAGSGDRSVISRSWLLVLMAACGGGHHKEFDGAWPVAKLVVRPSVYVG